jgi:NitT/TauT family transport system permease protein
MAQTYFRTGGRALRTRPSTAWWIDIILLLALAAAAYGVLQVAGRWNAPLTPVVQISNAPSVLPMYAALSTLRMAIAYLLALVFSLVYARIAIAHRTAERFMIPLLDILQSIPILSFMPGVVLGLVALFPRSNLGLELAAVVLIFTSQAWNIAFGFHQSLRMIPKELGEAASIYRLGFWRRFTRLELPFGMIPLIWNSMMSWAGGWFFLMAAEQFRLGNKDFRLPGLGSYLQTAASTGDLRGLLLGLVTLIAVIVLLDLFLWRPLVAWSERFKFEQSGASEVSRSAVLTALRRSAALAWMSDRMLRPLGERLDEILSRPGTDQMAEIVEFPPRPRSRKGRILQVCVFAMVAGVALWSTAAVVRNLSGVRVGEWELIGAGAGATLLRTSLALAVGAAWTIPVGVAIGLNPRWARKVQPLVQIVASIPATALFPALLLVFLALPGGLNVAAVALMLLGTQWYLLFNVIAGAMAIPSDLKEAALVYRLRGWKRWRYLILPAIFPYLVTGMITATGGAWNASIVSEYVTFGNQKLSTIGLGAVLAGAADAGNFTLLLASTLTMAVVVVTINRLIWRRLFALSEQRYRLD